MLFSSNERMIGCAKSPTKAQREWWLYFASLKNMRKLQGQRNFRIICGISVFPEPKCYNLCPIMGESEFKYA